MDLRVKRTNKYIIEAFIRLVEEKGFEQVTVQNIADEAMINRATFYAHYKDKQDLYEKIFDLAVESFTAILDFEDFVQGNRIKIRKIEAAMTELFTHSKQSFLLFDDHGCLCH